MSLVHGANSERFIAPRARQFALSLLEDAQVPDHVRSPMFRWQVAAWSRAAAVASLLYDWVCSLDPEQMTRPRLAGTRSPFDQWKAAEAHESRERSKLGLDPVSYAKLARDLALASKASEDALERMAAAGREIWERRDAELKVIEGEGIV